MRGLPTLRLMWACHLAGSVQVSVGEPAAWEHTYAPGGAPREGPSHGRASSEHSQHPRTRAQHPLPVVQGADHKTMPTASGDTRGVFRGLLQ